MTLCFERKKRRKVTKIHYRTRHMRTERGTTMIKKEYDDDKKHIHVLSYGGGTQSTALLLMALKGEIMV